MNLAPFCLRSVAPANLSMNKPFVKDGWRYATNGRILVRVPAPGEPDSKGGNFPDGSSFFTPKDFKWYPWPQATLEVFPTACFLCGNDLVGEIDEMQCPICADYGHYLYVKPVLVNNRLIDSWLNHLISKLPNVEYRTGGNFNEMIIFRFSGGEGSVMPLVRNDFKKRDDAAESLLSAKDGTFFIFENSEPTTIY